MQNAILCTHVGEIGWEIMRVVPYIMWVKKIKYKNNVKLIVNTRQDRFDLYGTNADILVPLEIKGDYENLFSDCFKLTGLSNEEYLNIIEKFKNNFSNKYNIIENIFPFIEGKKYTEKNQFKRENMIFEFSPRHNNKILVDNIIPNDKPIIVIAPRYRKFASFRNWNNWETLYDLLEQNLNNKYNFVLCGKYPEYIPDKKNRFYDINKIYNNNKTENTSLIGLTIEILKKSILCVGSQSGIPNLSNLLGVPTIQWGNQEKEHTITYNVKGTKTIFLKDPNFKISPNIVCEEIIKFIK